MYGLAYVLLPADTTSLQEQLDRALARFKRGSEEDFPREQLTFRDETDDLAALHRSRMHWQKGRIQWKSKGWESSFHLKLGALDEHMAACNLTEFEGLLAEVEPDFETFVTRFTRLSQRDPSTGKFGRWLNPVGRWDWWELGGRFNGVITGQRRPASDHQVFSSGDSVGRALIGNVVRALGAEPSAAEAEIELNVELVETLRQSFLADPKAQMPTAIVLPHGLTPDVARWFDDIEWHALHPETTGLLGLSSSKDRPSHRALVGQAFDRFHDHVAAGVAFHF